MHWTCASGQKILELKAHGLIHTERLITLTNFSGSTLSNVTPNPRQRFVSAFCNEMRNSSS